MSVATSVPPNFKRPHRQNTPKGSESVASRGVSLPASMRTALDQAARHDVGVPLAGTLPLVGIRGVAGSGPHDPIEATPPYRVGAHPCGRPRGGGSGSQLSVSPPIMLALLLLVSWYLGTVYGHISVLILPAPSEVLASLADGLSSGILLSNALVTVQESLLGFLLAVAVALPLGYGLAKSRLFRAAVQPYLAAGQAIPAIVIAPLLVIWLGYGLVPNVILCMLIVLFPMVITTVLGLQTIDQSLIDAARVEGASGWSLLTHVEFPLALPAVLAGVRTGLTLSVTGAVVGEFVSGGYQGLGALVEIAKVRYDTPALFATLIILATLAALYYGASWLLIKLAEAVY